MLPAEKTNKQTNKQTKTKQNKKQKQSKTKTELPNAKKKEQNLIVLEAIGLQCLNLNFVRENKPQLCNNNNKIVEALTVLVFFLCVCFFFFFLFFAWSLTVSFSRFYCIWS